MDKNMNSKQKISRMKKKEIRAGYFFLLPAILSILIWVIYPVITSFMYSFTDFDIISRMNFIGLNNYKRMLSDKDWLYALQRTFLYVLIFVPFMFVIALGAAELIKHLKFCSGFFRTSYFLPVVVSSVAAGSIFKLVLNTKMGVLNKLLAAIGLGKVNFLGDTTNALYACVMLAIWLGFGYNMIIFLAGLNDIPAEYYEAARIDGANSIQLFRHITFPGLARTSIFVLTMCFIDAFQVYDIISMLTDGGPNFSTTLVVQRIYLNAFLHFDMGYACAMTVILFFIIFVITMLQFRITSKMSDNGWG